MNAVRVLGIDGSLTATALCRIEPDSPPSVTVSRTKPNGEDVEAKLARLRYQRAAVVNAAQWVDLVVIEGLSFASKGSATRDLAGLWWLMVDGLVQPGFPELGIVAPSVLKKWATGTGAADKFLVGQHIAKRWPDVALRSNDEADALGVASIGLHHAGQLPWTPTAYQVEALTKVAWIHETREEVS